MKNPIDIDYIAQLARIALTAEEKVQYTQQLSRILEHIEQLQSLDVKDIEPTAHAYSIYNVYRSDAPGSTFTPAEALRNAPQLASGEPAIRDNQLVVPVVVE